MSEPFLGEITIVGFNFAPRGYALCDGQIMPINQNQALYSILGTMYGGDGRTTFGLPDLRGRTPLHEGNGGGSAFSLGQKGGQESVLLTVAEMPAHTHRAEASASNGDAPIPTGAVLASFNNGYHDPSNNTTIRPGTTANSGGGQGHNNMQPFLALNYCIALQGTFPSRN